MADLTGEFDCGQDILEGMKNEGWFVIHVLPYYGGEPFTFVFEFYGQFKSWADYLLDEFHTGEHEYTEEEKKPLRDILADDNLGDHEKVKNFMKIYDKITEEHAARAEHRVYFFGDVCEDKEFANAFSDYCEENGFDTMDACDDLSVTGQFLDENFGSFTSW